MEKTKSGFKTQREALKAGIIAYNEYMQTGHNFIANKMSYFDYLDYCMKEHCKINLKYHTIQAYQNIIKNHVKPRIGFDCSIMNKVDKSKIMQYIEKDFF